MKCPIEFTTEKLKIANTIILIPKGELIYPYVKYITENFKFELCVSFDKDMTSNNHLILLQLSGTKKMIKIIIPEELTTIGYLRGYDIKNITRLIKLKNILEV